MNSEGPKPTMDSAPPTPAIDEAAAAPVEQPIIDAVPGVVRDTTFAERQGVVQPVGIPVRNGETISTTNNMRTPVLGKPPGMSNEQANAQIRDFNARKAETQ